MNKISKKIVALATMAAFVLTLVPAAAFGATSTKAVALDMSSFNIVDSNGDVDMEVSADTTDKFTAEFSLCDNAGDTTNQTLAANNVKIWAVDNETGKVSSALNVEDGTATVRPATVNPSYYVVTSAVADENTVTVSFSRGGEYTLYAGYGEIDSLVTLSGAAGTVVTVDGPTVTTAGITVQGVTTDDDNSTVTGVNDVLADGAIGDYTSKIPAGFLFNGIDTVTVEGVAYQADGSVAKEQTFTVESNRSELTINKKAEDTITTDKNGAFEFEIAMSQKNDYKLYISNSDISVTLNINAAAASNENITTIEDNAQVLLAGNDTKNYKGDNIPADFSDAVQFEITDEYGDVVTDDNGINGENAATFTDNTKYISIESKPDGSKLEASNLKLVWNESVQAYTLQYGGTAANAANAERDLIPGEYTVKVALNSGKSATATFTMAKYGTTQELVLKTQAKKTGAPAGDYVNITDEIALGQDLKISAKYVDENGIEIAATKAEYGADGKAVTSYGAKYPNQYAIGTEESLVGSTVYVKAFDSSVQKYAETELTVVDSYNTYTLAFNQEAGEANTENKVEVSVVDENGKVANSINGDVLAYVDTQSNKDARIEIDATDDVDNGKATITLFSDKETTADIVVAVKATNGAIYGKTLSYTFGAEDVNANTSVVMTIGSSDMVVNNQVVAMEDAAPYVANDRTYVPFRALGEALGAEVEWDNDARTVTYTLGKTEVVMTIGEKTYTVNGEEKTMDVAPEITNDRTYVPVRFVGEALGFKVTALSAADGTTASVVFQK